MYETPSLPASYTRSGRSIDDHTIKGMCISSIATQSTCGPTSLPKFLPTDALADYRGLTIDPPPQCIPSVTVLGPPATFHTCRDHLICGLLLSDDVGQSADHISSPFIHPLAKEEVNLFTFTYIV